MDVYSPSDQVLEPLRDLRLSSMREEATRTIEGVPAAIRRHPHISLNAVPRAVKTLTASDEELTERYRDEVAQELYLDLTFYAIDASLARMWQFGLRQAALARLKFSVPVVTDGRFDEGFRSHLMPDLRDDSPGVALFYSRLATDFYDWTTTHLDAFESIGRMRVDRRGNLRLIPEKELGRKMIRGTNEFLDSFP